MVNLDYSYDGTGRGAQEDSDPFFTYHVLVVSMRICMKNRARQTYILLLINTLLLDLSANF